MKHRLLLILPILIGILTLMAVLSTAPSWAGPIETAPALTATDSTQIDQAMVTGAMEQPAVASDIRITGAAPGHYGGAHLLRPAVFHRNADSFKNNLTFAHIRHDHRYNVAFTGGQTG